MDALRQIETWGAGLAAAGVVRGAEVVAVHGPRATVSRLASVTKLCTALAVLVAAEEGAVDLDEAAGPPGSTVRHLLAHASGLPFDAGPPLGPPERRRMYSNHGFDVLGEHLARRTGIPFAEYLREAVLAPLGMRSELREPSAGSGLHGSLDDVLALAVELQRPTLVAPETFAEAVTVQFPGLDGVVPGLGRFTPCDWGLGFELRGRKAPHWTGGRNSPRTFGHFGGAGTFLWVDPDAGVALACVTDREFDPWALQAWPRLSDAVLAELAA